MQTHKHAAIKIFSVPESLKQIMQMLHVGSDFVATISAESASRRALSTAVAAESVLQYWRYHFLRVEASGLRALAVVAPEYKKGRETHVRYVSEEHKYVYDCI
jgi:hypothetical protein